MVRTSETPPGMAGLAKFVPGGNIRESATTPAPNQPEISLAPEKAFHFRKNAEAARLPAPLVFLEVDLRRFSFMPVHVDLLLRSEFVAKATADVFHRALLLWCACWHEVPAASLPDDDMVLAKLAHYRGSMKKFRRLKPKILYGFVFCSGVGAGSTVEELAKYHLRLQEKAGESGSVHCGLSARYCMCWPPLIAILAPVTNAASSEHR